MLIRIVVVGVAIAALMFAVKDGRVLKAAGLTGSCRIVQTESDGTQLEACKPGAIDGAPDLSRDSCTQQGSAGTLRYWQCPAPIAAQPGG